MRIPVSDARQDRSEHQPRVLFVASCWYSDESDPTDGIFVRRHAEAIARYCRIVVLAPTANRVPRRLRAAVADEGGLATVRVPLPSGPRPLRDVRFAVGAVSAARAAARALRDVDVVHYNVAPSAALYAGVSLALRSVPHVVTEHWTGYLPTSDATMSPLRRALVRRIVQRAAEVTTVSDDLRRAMSTGGFVGRYSVVPNAVDTDLFRPGPQGLDSRSCRRWIAVARAAPVKNLGGIIEVFGRLRNEHRDLELHIHGRGPELPRLQARVAALGLGASVVLHGAGKPAVIAASMAASDALVLFSDYENSPCVIGEAMACGLPVVATDVGGVSELVPPYCGLLVPPRDGAALRDAIERLATRGDQYDRATIRDEAVSRFSYSAVGQRFESIYRSLSS